MASLSALTTTTTEMSSARAAMRMRRMPFSRMSPGRGMEQPQGGRSTVGAGGVTSRLVHQGAAALHDPLGAPLNTSYRFYLQPQCHVSSSIVPPNHHQQIRLLSRAAAASAMSASATSASATSTDVAASDESTSSVFPDELPKAFDFSAEPDIYTWWESQGFFKPKEDEEGSESSSDPFVISMPPPNVTGALHMGHAMFVTLEDIMVRHWRMRGRPTLWLPGTDHAGIATQLVVEKMLAAEGVTRQELGRKEFEKRVWQWKEQYGGTIARQIRRLGASCDWSRERFTLDDQLSKAVVEAFLRLHKKGLLYRGSYMVNWSPNLQTAVSDLEVEYSEEMGTLFYFKYPIAGTEGTNEGEYLPVATTRPETLLGDTAVAVNPEDERYRSFIGKFAVVPLSGGRQIPIIADEYVDKEFGTGALKITPGHDINDYAMGQKLGLPIINIMNKDGTLNKNAGAYCGMDRFDARAKVWSDLKDQGLTIKEEKHQQRVPRSQRGGEVIEPLVSKQWFVRMGPLAEPALAATKDGSLKIIPERFEKIYNFWLEGIRDWCISRQLWWGHRIPVFYVKRKQDTNGSAVNRSTQGRASREATEGTGEGEGGEEEEYVVASSEEEAMEKVRRKYGVDGASNLCVVQDPDVLDTWFSSGLWPFSTLGWPNEDAPDYKRFYPTAVMETGHDILFFWVARMTMMGLELTGKLPFSTIYLHGLVRDSQGRKMSKSLGNVIDPLDSISEYGTDALRFTLATGTTPGQDVNLSTERLVANKAFTNKLWNAGKFILLNLPQNTETEKWSHLSSVQFSSEEALHELPLTERWLVSRLHEVVEECTEAYEKFEFGTVGRVVYDFFWSDFADWYIEASKTRLYTSAAFGGPSPNGESDVDPEHLKSQAQAVLVYAFDTVLRLLHPFMPYVTEQLWQALPHKGASLMVATWPAPNLPQDATALQQFSDLRDLVRSIRNARAEYSVEPARKIAASVVVPASATTYFQAEKSVLCTLARVDPELLSITSEAPGDSSQSIHLVVTDDLEAFLPLAGLLDIAKEQQRLGKQASKLEADLAGLTKRLSASSFVEKAPKEVVDAVKKQAEDANEKLKVVNGRLEQLKAMQTQ